MNENEYISRLKARDIRPTALRLLILRTMAGFDRAFSLADLEEELDTVVSVSCRESEPKNLW